MWVERIVLTNDPAPNDNYARKETLDARVIREWKEDRVVTRYITFKVGTFKGAEVLCQGPEKGMEAGPHAGRTLDRPGRQSAKCHLVSSHRRGQKSDHVPRNSRRSMRHDKPSTPRPIQDQV